MSGPRGCHVVPFVSFPRGGHVGLFVSVPRVFHVYQTNYCHVGATCTVCKYAAWFPRGTVCKPATWLPRGLICKPDSWLPRARFIVLDTWGEASMPGLSALQHVVQVTVELEECWRHASLRRVPTWVTRSSPNR